jgi:MATE family multidrug resistance protein
VFAHALAVVRRELRPTLRLALPLAFAELGWMTMGIVDTLMVGRLPDSAVALGAVSLGSTLYYLVAIFANGLLLGLDTLVSHAFGRRDLDDARQSLATGVLLALLLSPLVMGVVMIWPPLMQAAGVQPEIVAAMRPFLYALNWGTLPLLLSFAMRRYLQAVHVVAPVSFAYISANAVNALFNWMFIFGKLGSPAFGLPGSGWSTCAARTYMAMVLAFSALRFLRHHPSEKPLMIFNFARARAVLELGLPAATQILLEIGVFAVVSALIGKLGAVPLAGHQIAINCASFTYMVPLGISSAAAVRVGNALGRGDAAAAREAGWMAILLGAGFMSFAGIALVSVPRLIARAFTPDPAVIAAGATLLVIAAAFQLFDGLQTVATGALRGAGDTRTPMIANLVAYWLVGLPIAWWLGFRLRWGASGLWIGLCAGLMLLGTALLIAWQKKARSPLFQIAQV